MTPVAEQRPDDLAIAYLLGTALIRDDQPTRGQVFIDRILRNGDSAETWLLLGTTKLQRGRLSRRRWRTSPRQSSSIRICRTCIPTTGRPCCGPATRPALATPFAKRSRPIPYDFTANLQLAVLLKEDEQFDDAARMSAPRAADPAAGHPGALPARHDRRARGQARGRAPDLEAIVKEAPAYTEAHVTLATVYYRLQRKDGRRSRTRHRAEAERREAGEAAAGRQRQMKAVRVAIGLMAAVRAAAASPSACAPCHRAQTARFAESRHGAGAGHGRRERDPARHPQLTASSARTRTKSRARP